MPVGSRVAADSGADATVELRCARCGPGRVRVRTARRALSTGRVAIGQELTPLSSFGTSGSVADPVTVPAARSIRWICLVAGSET